jgi:Rod binding domain-containing protein
MSYTNVIGPKGSADLLLEGTQAGTKQVSSGRAEKVRKYAREFEANLLANLYKDMQHSLGGLPGDEDPGADTLTDMGVHALAAGIVAGGGIGIANLLIHHLMPKGDIGTVTESPNILIKSN